MPSVLRLFACVVVSLALLLAGCRTTGAPVTEDVAAPAAVPPPTVTRGEFTIEAGELDTWNAVGQIAVRTPGVAYDGRSQMLELYALRYRGATFMVLTKGLPLSESIRRPTTRVTATTPAGRPIDDDAVAALLTLLQRDLPAEIESVRKRQAEDKRAKAKVDARRKKN